MPNQRDMSQRDQAREEMVKNLRTLAALVQGIETYTIRGEGIEADVTIVPVISKMRETIVNALLQASTVIDRIAR